jgi:uncharacterized protein (UPF0264 family)
MVEFKLPTGRPGLLVSVRNVEEARAALAGGADVIDVKEPSRGSLGAADGETIAAVVRAVAGRVPVTAAGGELLDLCLKKDLPLDISTQEGIALFKLGLAGCGKRKDWIEMWRQQIAALAGQARPAAVVYADWQLAAAPSPEEVFQGAEIIGCPALLIDTWNKSAGTLFDHWPVEDLAKFLESVRQRGLITVLAGSLSGDAFLAALELEPALVAVRGAACAGNREGSVSADRVRALRQAMAATSPMAASIAKGDESRPAL